MDHLITARSTIPADPTTTPADNTAMGNAKLPEPILDLAKLKKVATTLQQSGIVRETVNALSNFSLCSSLIVNWCAIVLYLAIVLRQQALVLVETVVTRSRAHS